MMRRHISTVRGHIYMQRLSSIKSARTFDPGIIFLLIDFEPLIDLYLELTSIDVRFGPKKPAAASLCLTNIMSVSSKPSVSLFRLLLFGICIEHC